MRVEVIVNKAMSLSTMQLSVCHVAKSVAVSLSASRLFLPNLAGRTVYVRYTLALCTA